MVRQSRGLLTTYDHPDKGPAGGPLATDVARFGPADAPRVLMLICGTHGVEGLAGSGCILDWLTSNALAPAEGGIATVLVHALNPFGMAWRQRQTEENIDLNRNFGDFGAGAVPSRQLYDDVHNALVRAQPATADWDDAAAELCAVRARLGDDAYYAAVMGGQDAHPDGLFFSGRGPSWARRTLLQLIADHAGAARQLAVVDFHTGLGPYGFGILGAADRPGSGGLGRAHSWFGTENVRPIESLIDNRSATAAADRPMGDLGTGLQTALPHVELTCVALEYGTYDRERLINVYRANCWMQKYGSRVDSVGDRIAAEFEAFFYPREARWQAMVLARAREVTRKALVGLLASGGSTR